MNMYFNSANNFPLQDELVAEGINRPISFVTSYHMGYNSDKIQ